MSNVTNPAKAVKAIASADQSKVPGLLKDFKRKKVAWYSVDDFLKKYHWYQFNREEGTDPERVADIAYDIAFNDTDWMLSAVIVDEKSRTVLDGNTSGQAQVKACKDYGVNLEILVMEVELPKGMTVHKAVHILNDFRKNWRLRDYIGSSLKQGKADFIRLKELSELLGECFLTTTKTPQWRYTLALIGSNQDDRIKEDKFTFSKKDQERCFEIGSEIVKVWTMVGRPKTGTWFEAFVLAWCRSRDFFGKNFDLDVLYECFGTKNGRKLFDGCESTVTWKDRLNSMLMGKFDKGQSEAA